HDHDANKDRAGGKHVQQGVGQVHLHASWVFDPDSGVEDEVRASKPNPMKRRRSPAPLHRWFCRRGCLSHGDSSKIENGVFEERHMASAMASIAALKDLGQQLKVRMDKTIEDFRGNLLSTRTGRASVQMLDQIKIDYYGTDTQISQVAQ